MAIEVQCGSYQTLPHEVEPSSSKPLTFAEMRAHQRRDNKQNRKVKPTDPYSALPFRHNYLHDVESLWWIAVWGFFTTRPKSSPHVKRLEIVDRIFHHSLENVASRILFFSSIDNRARTELLPQAFLDSYSVVDCTRVSLRVYHQHFRRFVLGTTTEEFTFGDIYAEVIDDFHAAANSAASDLEMIPNSNV